MTYFLEYEFNTLKASTAKAKAMIESRDDEGLRTALLASLAAIDAIGEQIAKRKAYRKLGPPSTSAIGWPRRHQTPSPPSWKPKG
jgi:hypothetical protein